MNKCQVCSKEFPYNYLLKRHLGSKRKCIVKINKQNEINTMINNNNKISLLKIRLDNLQKIITDNENKHDNDQCGYCRKIYSSKSNLKSHIKNKCKFKNKLLDEIKSIEIDIEFEKNPQIIPILPIIPIPLDPYPNAPPNNLYKRRSIPKKIRELVWDSYIGRHIGETKCKCCEQTNISQLSFHCGHIISDYNGGDTALRNLLPICISCNLSMGTTNLYDFKKRFGL